MPDPMTPDRLAEIEARANAATEGPWEAWDRGIGFEVHVNGEGLNSEFRETFRQVDAEFIAAARTDVPALLVEVRRLQGAAERVRELHKPVAVYAHADECGCGDEDHVLIESTQGDDLCWGTSTGEVRCRECLDEDGGDVAWPCPTIAELEEPTWLDR